MNNGKSKVRFPKNLIVIFTSIFIIVSLVSFYFFDQQKQQIESGIYADLKSVADLKISQLVQWIKDRSGDAVVISQSPFFIKNFDEWFKDTNNEKEEDNIKKRLTLLIKRYGYESIFITDKEGNNILSVGSGFDSYDKITKSKISEAFDKKEITITDFYYCNNENKIHYDLIAPLFNNSNQPIAFLVLRVNPYDYLYPLIQKWPKKSKSAETLIVRQDGDSVLFLNELRHRRNSALKLKVPLTSNIPAAEAVKGKVGFIESVDYRNVDVISYINKVPNSNWFMVSKIDKDEIYEPLYRFTLFYSVFVLSGFGLFVVLIILVWKRAQYKEKIATYQTQLEREGLRERYDYLIKHANDVILLIDKDGNIIQANDITEHVLGYSVNEITRMNQRNLVVLKNTMEKTRSKIIEDGSYLFESLYYKKDGSKLPVEISAKAIRIENKTYIQEIIRDISERKKFENEILNRNAILNAIINNSHSINIFMIDRDYRYIKFNENHRSEMEKNFGVNIDVGMNMLDCIAEPDYKIAVKQSINKVLSGASFVELRFDQISNTYYEYHWNQVRKPDDEIFAASCFIIDVTERIQNAERIKHLNSVLNAIRNVNQLIVKENDPKELIKQACELLIESRGYKQALIVLTDENKNIVDYSIASEDSKFVDIMGKEIVKGGLKSCHKRALIENKLVTVENVVSDCPDCPINSYGKNVSVMVYPIKHDDKLYGIMSIALPSSFVNDSDEHSLFFEVAGDIGYALHKMDLETEKQLFNRVLENSLNEIFIFDIHSFKFLSVNRGGRKNLGYRLDELKQMTPLDIKPEISKEQFLGLIEPLRNGNREKIQFETVHRRKDGSLYPVEVSLSIHKKENLFVAIVNDTTERKRAEDILKASEEQFRLLFENSPIGIGVADLNGNLLTCNNAILKQGNYSRDDMSKIGNVAKLYYQPEQREEIISIFQTQGFVKNHQVQFKRKDGSPYFALLSLTRTIFKGKPCIQAIVEDITERKKAEAALKDNELKLRNIFEHSSDLFYSHDTNHVLHYLSPQIKKILGYEVEEALIKWTEFASDNPINEIGYQKTLKAIETGIAQDPYELELIHKNGNKIWVEVREAPVVENGKTISIVGSLTDITDRKLTAEKLRESEERFRGLYENSTIGLYRTTPDGKIILANPALVKLLGFDSFEELTKRNLQQSGFESEHSREKFLNIIGTYGVVTGIESVWQKKDGTFINVRESASVTRDVNGKTLYYDGTVEDITERKKAEEALVESEKKFRSVVEEAVEIVFTVDNNGYFTYVNPAGLKTSGYTLEELTKIKYIDLIQSDYKQRVTRNYIKQYLQRRETTSTEYPFRTKSGVIKWFNQNARLIIENNSVVGFYVIARDVTERRKTEDALKESEERFRYLFETSYEGILAADEDENIYLANPRIAEMLGYSVEELKKMNFKELIAPDDLKDHLSKKEIRRSGKSEFYERRLIRKDGLFIWTLIAAGPTFNKVGAYTGSFGMFTDITKRKKAEETTIKLSRAVVHSPVSIVITNYNGNIEYVNPMFTKITGYALEEVIGQNPRILKSGYQPKEFYQKLWDTILSGKDFVGEMYNKKKNGESFWENVYISPIVNENGEITHFVAVKEDITEKKKNIEELVNAKEKAEKADKLKSEFLAQMSHEIRTPINVILSFNNILKDEVGSKLEPELYKMFESVDFASSRIIRTIDMILNMSELQTGTYEPNFKIVNIKNNVLDRLITEHFRVAKEKKLELVSRYNTEHLNVKIDEYSVIQIFNNLIDNAIKYTNKGKIEIEIRRNDENKLEVIVSDTGIGMGKEYLPKLFEPFSQEEHGYSRLYEGNGLGLALVKRYCEINNAEIFVESEKGVGSKIKVVFK